MKLTSILFLILATMPVFSATLKVQPDKVLRTVDRHRFLGTNIGLWFEARKLLDADVQYYLRELNPSFIRIPGGSWSDSYIWNGNGIWDGNRFDMSKYKNGVWEIDYSGYAPGFNQVAPGKPDEWHGNVDVYALHDFARDKGAHSIVTVNVGTGTPKMAAEWVRWANLKEKFGVKYWEIGNELEGSWEMGSTMPDGKRMTGKDYARKFIEFAKAMKAVDPTIKVGGPTAANTRAVFLEDFLKYAGEHVDFISIHTYPVNRATESDREVVGMAMSLRKPMRRYRKLVETYQPKRKDEIEIAVTEWNMKVVEDRDSADLLCGLWSAVFVGEMFRQGVGFATQWDLLTATPEGGHGMFDFRNGRCQPKSQYWGLYMWSKFMGDELVESKLDGARDAYAVVTRDGERLYAMVVNTSRTDPVAVSLDAPGVEFAVNGRTATLSHREYFWDPYKHEIRWSRAPAEKRVEIGTPSAFEVPPFCVKVFELPFKGHGLRNDEAVRNAGIRPLEILLPASVPCDEPVEGWVFLQNDPEDPRVPWRAKEAAVSVEGPARLDVEKVRLAEAAGRFHLIPTGPGKVIVRAKAGKMSVERTIELRTVKERDEILWTFEDTPADWPVKSSWKIVADDTVRPNQNVAAVVLEGAVPKPGADRLAVFSPLPEELPKKRIGGVVFDIGVSGDFQCDASTAVRVVLQSTANHWIDLGTVPLAELRGKWKTVRLKLPDPKLRKAMFGAYGIYFQLFENGERPVKGRVYLDNTGVVLR
jgi:hypothetical protein